MEAQDIVYIRHCCLCPRRHLPNCFYSECSFDQYCKWLEEARREIVKNDNANIV